MAFQIPHHREPHIEQLAQAQHLSTDESLDRILAAGLERLVPSLTAKPLNALDKGSADVKALYPTYGSLLGSVDGPRAHGSREAVDRYITELRKEYLSGRRVYLDASTIIYALKRKLLFPNLKAGRIDRLDAGAFRLSPVNWLWKRPSPVPAKPETSSRKQNSGSS